MVKAMKNKFMLCGAVALLTACTGAGHAGHDHDDHHSHAEGEIVMGKK